MPISDDEWEAGETSDEATLGGILPGTEEDPGYTGDLGTEKDLIVAFLAENADAAFTRSEVIRGVDFGGDDDRTDPEHYRDKLRELPSDAFDLLGDVTASAIVVTDVDEALDELVAEGMVETREVETEAGTETYYRIAGQ